MNKKKRIILILILVFFIIGGMTMFFTRFQSDEVKAVRLASERTRVNLGEFGEIIDYSYRRDSGGEIRVNLQILIDDNKVDAAVKAVEAKIKYIAPDDPLSRLLLGKEYADEKLESYDSIKNYEKAVEGIKAKTVHACVSIVEVDGKTYLFYGG